MLLRLDARRVDAALAGVLFVVAEVQVAFSGARGWVLVSQMVVAGLVTAAVAVRRRFPAAVGIGVQALLAVEGLVVHLPAGAVTVAWFCALYGLAVWTTWPWFVAGTAFFV